MEIAKNEIRIDVRSNPQLKEFFARKADGESCTLEITFRKKSQNDDAVTGIVRKIAPEGYEPTSPEEPKEVEPSGEEPVMVVIAGGPAKAPKAEAAYA